MIFEAFNRLPRGSFVRLIVPAKNAQHGSFAVGETFQVLNTWYGSARLLSRVSDRAKLAVMASDVEPCPDIEVAWFIPAFGSRTRPVHGSKTLPEPKVTAFLVKLAEQGAMDVKVRRADGGAL